MSAGPQKKASPTPRPATKGGDPPSPPVVEPGAEGDRPIARDADDRLGFALYADAISRLIQHEETGTPFVLAINARWGAGKSSLANLIEARLTRGRESEGERPHVVCWFNAWMHDDAASLRTAFSATVAKAADRARPYWRRLVSPLPLSLLSPVERLKVYGPIYVGGTAALLLVWAFAMRIPGVDGYLRALLGKIDAPEGAKNGALTAAVGLLVGYLPKLRAMGGAVASFVRHPTDAANQGSIAAARAQLGELIAQAVGGSGRRFVVFVDDVERCHPPKPIEALEAVNQLADHPDVVVVLLGDMAAVAANAGLKYKDLACVHTPDGPSKLDDGEAMRVYGYRYVQKIVQLQFDVPSDAEITAARLDGLETGPPPLLDGWEPSQDPPPSEGRRASWLPKPADLGRAAGRLLLACPTFFFEQARFPAWAFTTPERVQILLTTVGQGLLALSQIVGLVLLPLLTFRQTHDPSRAAVAFGVAWVAYTVLGALVRLLFARAVRRAMRNWIGRFAASPAVAFLDADEARARMLGTFVGRARLTDAQVETLRAQIDRHCTSFEAAFRRRKEMSRLAEDPDAVAAFDHAVPFLPPLPRNAKRLRNAVRLSVYIMKRRGMVPHPVSPQAIGKWAALREGWPDVAERLMRDPGLVGQLEPHGAVFGAHVEEIVRAELPAYAADWRLRRLLSDGHPITPMVRCVARLGPAP